MKNPLKDYYSDALKAIIIYPDNSDSLTLLDSDSDRLAERLFLALFAEAKKTMLILNGNLMRPFQVKNLMSYGRSLLSLNEEWLTEKEIEAIKEYDLKQSELKGAEII